eukprot:sb/3468043/
MPGRGRMLCFTLVFIFLHSATSSTNYESAPSTNSESDGPPINEYAGRSRAAVHRDGEWVSFGEPSRDGEIGNSPQLPRGRSSNGEQPVDNDNGLHLPDRSRRWETIGSSEEDTSSRDVTALSRDVTLLSSDVIEPRKEEEYYLLVNKGGRRPGKLGGGDDIYRGEEDVSIETKTTEDGSETDKVTEIISQPPTTTGPMTRSLPFSTPTGYFTAGTFPSDGAHYTSLSFSTPPEFTPTLPEEEREEEKEEGDTERNNGQRSVVLELILLVCTLIGL